MNRIAWACALAISLIAGSAVAAETPAERLVHRYLTVAVSPDGRRVASVEGDSPPSGRSPTVRDLAIRGVDGATAVLVPMPCGRVPQCWPSSPVWSPDGKHLTFALRTPGTHARSLYRVDPDGGHLTKLLDFDGTITDLRYGRDGRLAMLATAGATKEVGATEAGAPITGDLGGPPAEQRIAILEAGRLSFASPPDLFVYQYDWRPDGSGFVGTAAPGDGDNNWWVAKLYSFSGGAGRVLFAPSDPQHQIADPHVSPDGKSVAFISGIMSDFGSTGGDVYALPLAGGPATDITPAMPASATSLGWGCDGRLLAKLLAGDQTQIVQLTPGASPKLLWSGAESLSGQTPGLSLSCPTWANATVHETFTTPPEIEVGRIGAWRDLTPCQRRPHHAAHRQEHQLDQRWPARAGLAAAAPGRNGQAAADHRCSWRPGRGRDAQLLWPRPGSHPARARLRPVPAQPARQLRSGRSLHPRQRPRPSATATCATSWPGSTPPSAPPRSMTPGSA